MLERGSVVEGDLTSSVRWWDVELERRLWKTGREVGLLPSSSFFLGVVLVSVRSCDEEGGRERGLVWML